MNKVKNKQHKKLSTKKKVLIILIAFFSLSFGSGLFLMYGPYDGFRTWLITTAMTTMNHQYLATWFYSDDTINKVLLQNRIIEPDKEVDTSLIEINTDTTNNVIYKNEYEKQILDREEDALYKIINIKENGFEGYLAAIYDPSKIKVVTSSNIGAGEYLVDMANKAGAVLAINGGGFLDNASGTGNGGVPIGIVISNNQIINRYSSGNGIIGFTEDNKLFLGKISAEEAINKGIRDAVEFGPFLIVNGEASSVVGNGGYGTHPRSAIGQRQDGIVLFLVIDGRRITSLGADMDDLINIMQRYGAINAANLDGGNSSVLVENGKILNKPLDWYNQEQTRPISNGFVVVE